MTQTYDMKPRDVGGKAPAYVHDTARMYGDVRLREGSSVWCNVVVRAEAQYVEIGPYANIQDFVMIHIGFGTPTLIGANCSITHHVTLHGCAIGDNCLIGIGATIMDGCVIGPNSIVAGGAFLKEGTVIPPDSIVMGTPGKVVRTRNNFVANKLNAFMYHMNAEAFARGHYRVWDGPEFVAAAAAEREKIAAEAKRLFPGEVI